MIVLSFNWVFSNFKHSNSFIDFFIIFSSKFSIFISDKIVKGSVLSNNFFVIIFEGIGGALLFMKLNTPVAVEFTLSKNDFCVWGIGWVCWGMF